MSFTLKTSKQSHQRFPLLLAPRPPHPSSPPPLRSLLLLVPKEPSKAGKLGQEVEASKVMNKGKGVKPLPEAKGP